MSPSGGRRGDNSKLHTHCYAPAPPSPASVISLVFLAFFTRREDETAKVDTASSLMQYLPAPQLTHYEGLFAKYMQSLPALER